MKILPHDPEKQACDPGKLSPDQPCDVSCDPSIPTGSHDQTCDLTQSCVQIQLHDLLEFKGPVQSGFSPKLGLTETKVSPRLMPNLRNLDQTQEDRSIPV